MLPSKVSFIRIGNWGNVSDQERARGESIPATNKGYSSITSDQPPRPTVRLGLWSVGSRHTTDQTLSGDIQFQNSLMGKTTPFFRPSLIRAQKTLRLRHTPADFAVLSPFRGRSSRHKAYNPTRRIVQIEQCCEYYGTMYPQLMPMATRRREKEHATKTQGR